MVDSVRIYVVFGKIQSNSSCGDPSRSPEHCRMLISPFAKG